MPKRKIISTDSSSSTMPKKNSDADTRMAKTKRILEQRKKQGMKLMNAANKVSEDGKTLNQVLKEIQDLAAGNQVTVVKWRRELATTRTHLQPLLEKKEKLELLDLPEIKEKIQKSWDICSEMDLKLQRMAAVINAILISVKHCKNSNSKQVETAEEAIQSVKRFVEVTLNEVNSIIVDVKMNPNVKPSTTESEKTEVLPVPVPTTTFSASAPLGDVLEFLQTSMFSLYEHEVGTPIERLFEKKGKRPSTTTKT